MSSGLGAGTGDGGNGVAGGAGTGERGKGCGCSGAWAIVVSARSPMPTTAHMKRTTENGLIILIAGLAVDGSPHVGGAVRFTLHREQRLVGDAEGPPTEGHSQ